MIDRYSSLQDLSFSRKRVDEIPVDYTIQSVQKALWCLKLFQNGEDELTLTQIAAGLQLTKSSTLRILYTLKAEGFIAYDEATKHYSLGMELVFLGTCKTESLNWKRIAVNRLRKLANDTGMICYLAIEDAFKLVFIDKVFPKTVPTWAQLMLQSGASTELFSTGIGRLFLAHFKPEKLAQYFATVERRKITPDTITDEAQLHTIIDDARRDGLSYNDCENEPYIYSICAPIYDMNGKMIAGISICGIRSAFEGQSKLQLTAALRKASAEISAQIGYKS